MHLVLGSHDWIKVRIYQSAKQPPTFQDRPCTTESLCFVLLSETWDFAFSHNIKRDHVLQPQKTTGKIILYNLTISYGDLMGMRLLARHLSQHHRHQRPRHHHHQKTLLWSYYKHFDSCCLHISRAFVRISSPSAQRLHWGQQGFPQFHCDDCLGVTVATNTWFTVS